MNFLDIFTAQIELEGNTVVNLGLASNCYCVGEELMCEIQWSALSGELNDLEINTGLTSTKSLRKS